MALRVGAEPDRLQMASLCRRIVQRKRVRYIEDASLKEELAGLRDVMREHREAQVAQLAKEEELQRARVLAHNESSKHFEL
ncbi:hypothetical protein AK812_SmicGene12742 [Symbiodinium microadriaticum]|uniref:Uncharacterized protein n=1 Tax=Symbiodinium microadriaticum TaxID=2951 RepID=A0A1Q9E9V3_SYMMI|nr:hypothetical protein AK812_SmicGene12742 [Symbiodinium microadriaticum]